jgi:glycosyltransferase involved in cell wall biosynthesis
MAQEISVIMSVYNAEKYLLESVNSILNQEEVDFQLIIVNDGSTDNSINILSQIEQQDERVLVINQDNMGLAVSLNTAINISTGEYIARMDADDIADSKRLLKQLNFLKENRNTGIVGSYVHVFGDGKTRVWKYPLNNNECDVALLFLNPLAHPAVMFRRSVIDDIGLYDLSFEYDQDYELWARASGSHGISNIPATLLKYRIHNNQMGSVYSKIERVESQKRTQLFLLRGMGLNPSEDDMEDHLLLSNAYRLEFEMVNNYGGLSRTAKWIREIVEMNKMTRRYDDSLLRHRLYLQYNSLCLYMANKGLNVFTDFKITANYLGINTFNLTLWLSCLLKLGRKEHIVIYNQINRIKNFIRNGVN